MSRVTLDPFLSLSLSLALYSLDEPVANVPVIMRHLNQHSHGNERQRQV